MVALIQSNDRLDADDQSNDQLDADDRSNANDRLDDHATHQLKIPNVQVNYYLPKEQWFLFLDDHDFRKTSVFPIKSQT